MRALRERLSAMPRDAGLSLIEVIAAMMIFATVVLTIGYALVSSLVITRDNQARETAVNLASAELDAVRSVGDPFSVLDASRTVNVGTNTYSIERKTAWVTPAGEAGICGVGGGPLQYKAVAVEVRWEGMRNELRPVTSDTALVPVDRINDPTKGTILVNVIDSYGVGASGVTLTAHRGAASVPTTPTNADGCSFILKVEPGDYTITLTNPGYVSHTNESSPQITLPVAAGSSTSYHFQYDRAARYRLDLASNHTGSVRFPVNHTVTLFNTNGRSELPATSDGSIDVFPARTGYDVVAGSYVPTSVEGDSCTAVDPGSWEPDESVSPPAVGTRGTGYAPAGGTVDVDVPMGIVEVFGGSGSHLFAVSQTDTPLDGQPACDVVMEYRFGNVIPNGSSSVTIALPFGSWKLYRANNASGSWTQLENSRISLVTPGRAPDGSGLFVLDPRGVTP